MSYYGKSFYYGNSYRKSSYYFGNNKYRILVYKIVNNVDDTIYIGSTRKLFENRYSEHLRDFERKKKGCCYSSKLFEKYGTDNCDMEVIKFYYVSDRNEMYEKEAIHYDELQSFCINKNRPTKYKRKVLTVEQLEKDFEKKFVASPKKEVVEEKELSLEELEREFENKITIKIPISTDTKELTIEELEKEFDKKTELETKYYY